MKDHWTAEMVCPACGLTQDGALNVTGDEGPEDGDPTICADCRTILVYCGTPVNSLRYPTKEEQLKILAEPMVQKTIWAMGVVGPQPRKQP